MPEGPEIHRAADKLGAAIAGRVASEVCFAFDALKTYEAQLSGEKVTAVEARGKAMLVHFANNLSIYSHNQLYGKWMVRPAYDYPDTKRQLRLAIHNTAHSALLYSASEIEVLRNGELDAHPYLSKLGPDLLDTAVTVDQVAAQFHSNRFRRRRLSSLLLDQSFLAGVGNYLRSEILFVGRTHPTLRPADCSAAQIERLAEAAVTLARQSYATKGITNDLTLVAQLREQGVERRDYRFWVFGREDKACYECGAPIVKTSYSSRRCYYCPRCQAQSN
jgi:endonuclease-8